MFTFLSTENLRSSTNFVNFGFLFPERGGMRRKRAACYLCMLGTLGAAEIWLDTSMHPGMGGAGALDWALNVLDC